MRLLYLHDYSINEQMANVIQVLHMCQAFASMGLDVTLATPECNGVDSKQIRGIAAEIINKDIKFGFINYKKIKFGGHLDLIGGYPGVKALLKDYKTDVCFLRNCLFLNLLLNKDIPVIYESHNAVLHHTKWVNNLLVDSLRESSGSTSFLKFVCISDALANYWREQGMPSEKIIGLHDAVDAEAYKNPVQKEVARDILSLDRRKKIVLYAGSLYKNRGIENIINLARHFRELIFIVLGGTKKETENYENIVRNDGVDNVEFKGHVLHHQVKMYLYAADVLLMTWTKKVPTINYCSPLKTFEYMASGRPIVGHAFPTIKEVLEDGVTAFLADPDSFDDLRYKLRLAINSGAASTVGRRAREDALNRHTWDSRCRNIVNGIDWNNLHTLKKFDTKTGSA